MIEHVWSLTEKSDIFLCNLEYYEDVLVMSDRHQLDQAVAANNKKVDAADAMSPPRTLHVSNSIASSKAHCIISFAFQHRKGLHCMFVFQ